MGKFQDQVVVITGAGSGFGKVLSHQFAQEGAKVVICGRTLQKLTGVEQDLVDKGSDVLAIQADVSKEEEVQRLVQQAVETFGRIDVLINNAAVFENSTLTDTTLASWNDQFANNATSVFLTMKACVPLMRDQKQGTIINLTSSIAKKGGAGFGSYGASKAAIESLTLTVDEEENKHGVYVCAFNPGVMKTNMHGSGASPDSVAPTLLHIAANASQYAGQIVDIAQF